MSDASFGPNGWTPEYLGDLTGQVFVITGATSGTGYQAARLLLGHNATVIMLNRNPAKSAKVIKSFREEFGGDVPVSAHQMDLADLSSVRRAAHDLLQATTRIDAVICNAAIAQVPRRTLTVDGFESQLGTNHLGHFLLCGLLFDRITQSQGRIVTVASLGYMMGSRQIRFDDPHWETGYRPNAAYSQSKLAQMMMTYELQDRAQAAKRPITALVCHPGSSATSLIRTSGGRLTRAVFWMMTKTPLVQTAEKGAYPALMCATADGLPERALYGPTGPLQFTGPVGRGQLEPVAYEKAAMQQLWDLSERSTDFRWRM